jgi:hypothetical protein
MPEFHLGVSTRSTTTRFADSLMTGQETLIPEIRGLKGNRAYYVGIDRENNAMTNVSVWDTRGDAEQMATLQPMLNLAKIFIDAGVRLSLQRWSAGSGLSGT